MSKIVVSINLDELSIKAVSEFVRIANNAIENHGQFTVALSGGSTPKALYRKLLYADLDWEKIYFFFGDERNVPEDDEQSNFRMANESLFQPLGISKDRIYRWKTELGRPEAVAEQYAGSLREFFDAEISPPAHAGGSDLTSPPAHAGGSDLPRFDLVLLGMGADGHTASLFPHTAALKETQRQAVANWVPQLDAWRVTLTFPVINNARNVMFLVAGADKAKTLKDVIEGERRPEELPSQSVQPTDGKLSWFLDEAAASLLVSESFWKPGI